MNSSVLRSKIYKANSKMLKIYNLQHLIDKITFICEDIAILSGQEDHEIL